MIAEIRYARLQAGPVVRLHFRGGGLLQVAQNPRCRMMLVLETVTLFRKPLLATRLGANGRSSTRQILTGVVEIEHLLIDLGTKKIPIGFGAIRNTDEKRFWIQRPYMVDLTLHAIEKPLFSVLRRRPYVDRMQTLAMLVIERNAARHGFPPVVVANQHASAVNPDADRRDLAQRRRCITPSFFLGLHHRPRHGWPNPANWP